MSERNAELHTGHRERLRKQILENGLESLNEHQTLEAFLFYVVKRADTNELAHTILNETGGSFASAVNAGFDRLVKIKGVGEQIAYFFEFFRQASIRYLTTAYIEENCEQIRGCNDLCTFFERVFLGVRNEELHAVGLDDGLHIICEKRIAVGDPSSVGTSVRRLADFIIRNGLARIAIAHNHPAGKHTPSDEDIHYTNDLADFLEKMNVELVDHIVVGVGGAFSMRASYLANRVRLWRKK